MSLVIGASLVLGMAGCQSKVAVAAQEQVQQENRIIALSVSIVDILGELGVEMTGVPKSQYELHNKAEGITQVGLPMSPDLEIVASLAPTHVLSLTTLKSMVQPKLDQIGVEGTYLNMENINEMKKSITELGVLFNKEKEAAVLIEGFEQDVEQTLKSIEGKDAPKVLVLFGFPGNYLIATGASFVGQMVELLGGVNVVQEDSMAYASVNMEELIISQPDVILRLTHGSREEVIEMFDQEFSENQIWQQFQAVHTGRVYDLDDSKFNVSATLDTAEALRELAEIIYE